MLAVPSLNPIRLRGVSWLRLVVAVRPKPSCDQRIATVPRPIRARLRTAWKATWGSSAQACTQMSPPLSRGVQLVGRERRDRPQGRRALAAQPEAGAVSNRLGPKPKVTVRLRGQQADRLAGVVGRRQLEVVDVADHLAGGHFGRRPRPLPHQLAQLGRGSSVEQVEGGEVEAVLGGGGDPGLVLAVEGDRAGAARRWRRRCPGRPGSRWAPRPMPAAPMPADASRRRRVIGVIERGRGRGAQAAVSAGAA